MSDFIITFGKFALVAFAVYAVFGQFYKQRNNLGFILTVWKQIRIRMIFECLLVMAIVATAIVLLIQVPLLSKGWTALFYNGESSNIIMGPVFEGSKSSNILIRMLVPVFMIGLLVAVPFLAHAEEKSFRAKCLSWKAITRVSIIFGLIHCIVGIPLGAGLGLSLLGFFLGWKYRNAYFAKLREMGKTNVTIGHLVNSPTFKEETKLHFTEAVDYAVMRCTVYHTIYNSMLVILLTILTLQAI